MLNLASYAFEEENGPLEQWPVQEVQLTYVNSVPKLENKCTTAAEHGVHNQSAQQTRCSVSPVPEKLPSCEVLSRHV